MRIKLFTIFFLFAVIVVFAWLWVTRPTAIPVAPESVFPEKVDAENSAAPEPVAKPETGTKAQAKSKAEPGDAQAPIAGPANAPIVDELDPEEEQDAPLADGVDLQLAPVAALLSDEQPLITNRLAETPFLSLEIEPNHSAYAEVPKLKLFNANYGTRGVSSRRWFSRRFGVEAGVGLAEGETQRDREPAVGLGVVLSFD